MNTSDIENLANLNGYKIAYDTPIDRDIVLIDGMNHIGIGIYENGQVLTTCPNYRSFLLPYPSRYLRILGVLVKT